MGQSTLWSLLGVTPGVSTPVTQLTSDLLMARASLRAARASLRTTTRKNLLIPQLRPQLEQVRLILQAAPWRTLTGDARRYYGNIGHYLEQQLQQAESLLVTRQAETVRSAVRIDVEEQDATLVLQLKEPATQMQTGHITQTLEELGHLYRKAIGMLHADGQRLETIDSLFAETEEYASTANQYVSRAYKYARRYHKFVLIVLGLVLLWMLIRLCFRVI
ncbi:hypothetical protein GMRT_15253 [Giardia muris]|uniref:Uncharacterized protein n=1 Tax=Giardia muris TaxID=5742 RepID=A0A4Z1T515_GIAMU|nr:hypothetical protein GMRT_15253 [Giardia muris]|eukprot:TNJ28177.1 hypothetical protein GMRT_15253 [Giardia muris]